MPEQITVLIVDDDQTNRLILRALVNDFGYQSLEAENGRQAVDLAAGNDIDIVLLDIMMPVMDGYEAARRIKSSAKSFIPIIFLTALTDENALADCISAGGDDFLTKPYNHVLLQAKVSSMLRIRRLYKKVEEQNRQLNLHNSRIEQEVNVAKKVFGNLLRRNKNIGEAGLRFSMSPMSIFNGDMLLAEKNQMEGLDVLVSDFTGHGLSAAIGSIPVSDIFHTMTRKGFPCIETLVEANNKLVKLLPTQMFMAAALISMDRKNNVTTVINCGLPELYLWRSGEIVKVFESQNIPLGISSQPGDNFIIEMADLEYGDRLFVATDGIMEARNSRGEMFGTHGIRESIGRARSPETVFDTILDANLAFSGKAAQSDDITLLEICHLKNVDYKDTEPAIVDVVPAEWSMQLSLDIQSLRRLDVLPFIMQGVNELQSIPNGRSRVHTILAEILANALDHGILGLDSSMKNTADGYMQYYQEKARRLESYQEGNIRVMLNHELKEEGGGRLTIHVVDSGEGFDFRNVSTAIHDNSGYSGRGIALITQLCKDVKFLEKGNVVKAVYEWN